MHCISQGSAMDFINYNLSSAYVSHRGVYAGWGGPRTLIVNIWYRHTLSFRIILWLPFIPWWLYLWHKKELNCTRQKVFCLTLWHFDWPHWMESESSPQRSSPEDWGSSLLSVQLLPARAAAAASPPLPPSPRYLASPSLGPRSRCRSPRLRCRPPINCFVKRSFVRTF